MYCCGVAEQVVHVAKNLLIGSYKEYAQIVRLVLLQCMNGQRVGVVTIGNEVRYLSVGVAGNVLQGGVARRALVQTLKGKDGEKLVNSPRVAQTLEQREVAEVLVCQQFVDVHQLLGDMLQVLGQRIDFMAYAPVHSFNLGTRLQVHDTVCEQVEHLFPDLLGIVPVFKHIAR